MIDIDYKTGGEELAKVLIYYGLIPGVGADKYKIVCPFHNDVNPSMDCNLVDGTFYCYGCTASGDALKFVRLANPKMDDLSSLREYFRILKSDKVKDISCKRQPKPRHEDRQKLIEAMDYFYGLSTIDWRYNKQDEVESAYQYMHKRGFTAKALNIANARVTYNRNYPIVFPMLDNGIFRGWVCRTNDPKVEKMRKYLYNEGFSRATTLVGNYTKGCTVVIVEGYMDMLKMKMFGIRNVVAILGWKITNEQVKKLKAKGISQVVSALDNDECGIKGTAYLKKFFTVYRWQYEDGCKDAGDMNQKSFLRMKAKTAKYLPKTNETKGRLSK